MNNISKPNIFLHRSHLFISISSNTTNFDYSINMKIARLHTSRSPNRSQNAIHLKSHHVPMLIPAATSSRPLIPARSSPGNPHNRLSALKLSPPKTGAHSKRWPAPIQPFVHAPDKKEERDRVHARPRREFARSGRAIALNYIHRDQSDDASERERER